MSGVVDSDARGVVGVKVSSSTTDAVVSALGLVLAEVAEAEVLALGVFLPAGEAWHVGVHHGDCVPPFPVTVDLVVEPSEGAASDGHISSPCGIEIRFNHCICGIDISLRRNRHSGRDVP